MGGKSMGGGFMGIGGEGGFLGTGIMGTGAKVKGFNMSPHLLKAEGDMIARMNDVATGKTASISQLSMDQNVDQANKAALAMAASQRGASNPMLAFREAQIAGQEARMQAAQQGALMAQQEKMQANQMIAQQAASTRGVALQQDMANQATTMQAQKANRDVIQGGGQAAMQAMSMASDERVKTDINSAPNASDAIETFINAIQPHMYKYKNSKHGSGEKMGVMAQDLEKTAVGKTMVDEAPDGTKMVDTNKAIGVILAGMADMNKKLKKMEK